MTNKSIKIPGYDILRPLGSGGMSTVFLALQRSLDRKVAIKVMRRSGGSGDEASGDSLQAEKRFLLEGRMMAKLPHRNIVAVYDIVGNDEIDYISMEYLDGGTLSDRMRRGLALSEAIAVVVQIASALDFAHQKGVVHRDLKPANIMFRDTHTPVLTDFGIARMRDATSTRLTQTGMLVGTPTYMSPEQINGDAVDGRADQYSLGVLFYEMLAGTAPFRGETPISVLMAHLTQTPPPLPVEFHAFQPVLERMLAKKPDDRYADMHAFSEDLKSRLVRSDTLLMRLQLDPDQNSSEQLRALGFSVSSPSGSVGLRDSMRGRLSAAARAKSASESGLVSRSQADPASTASFWARLPRWQWITLGAGLVLIAIGAWLSLEGRGGLTKEQQQVVTLLLQHAQELGDKGNLVAPADENAYAYAQKVLDRDPANRGAQELVDSIAKTLAAQAQQALAAGKIDVASQLGNQALLVHPDDAGLRELAANIDKAKKAVQVRVQIRNLLQRAQVAHAAGREFGADGSYALLMQAHSLAPDDTEVNKRLDAEVATLLDSPRKALAAGNLNAALASLNVLQPHLAANAAFVALRGEADAMLKKQQVEKSVLALLATGREQLRAGHLAEPGGDNAIETLGELGKLSVDDKRVSAFAIDLAQALLADARRLDRNGEAQHALERAGLALQVAPSLADAQTLKQQIEQRLGARATKVAQALSSARQAIAEQRFVAPAADDAYDALRTVLAIDADNADAKQLMADLPKRIAAAAAARARTDSAAAVMIVTAARKVFAEDAQLTALAAKLDQQVASERAVAEAQRLRGQVEKVLAEALPDVAQLRAGLADLDVLLTQDATNKDTLALRARMIEAIGAGLTRADSTTDFDALSELLKQQSKALEGDASYAVLLGQAPQLRSKLVAAEQARAAAQQGELVLNAYPWATVESVVDADRHPVPLPADATTPLILTLPAGSYAVSFRHPQASKPVRIIAKVDARKRTQASAAFPSISTKEYFARAGW
ncbi:MAG: serine/threonine-protein kinase [Rudaea sp.]